VLKEKNFEKFIAIPAIKTALDDVLESESPHYILATALLAKKGDYYQLSKEKIIALLEEAKDLFDCDASKLEQSQQCDELLNQLNENRKDKEITR